MFELQALAIKAYVYPLRDLHFSLGGSGSALLCWEYSLGWSDRLKTTDDIWLMKPLAMPSTRLVTYSLAARMLRKTKCFANFAPPTAPPLLSTQTHARRGWTPSRASATRSRASGTRGQLSALSDRFVCICPR